MTNAYSQHMRQYSIRYVPIHTNMKMLQSTFEIQYPHMQYWSAWNIDWIREEFYDSNIPLDAFIAHRMTREHIEEFMTRRRIPFFTKPTVYHDDEWTFANAVWHSKTMRRFYKDNAYKSLMSNLAVLRDIRDKTILYGVLTKNENAMQIVGTNRWLSIISNLNTHQRNLLNV